MFKKRAFLAPVASFLLVAALSACGGTSSSVPSVVASSSPTPTATATATSSPTSAPTTVPATWTFGGSSANLAVTSGQTPSPVTLTAYNGLSATIQPGAPTSGSGTIVVSDALNNGDVSPNTLPTDNATAGATAVLYASFYNGGNTTISFGTKTPQISITDTNGFPIGATSCELDIYGKLGNGNTVQWNSIGATGTISGNTVKINSVTLPGGNTVDFQPGQQVAAVSCK